MKSPARVALNDIDLNLYVEGTGEPVLLLHGFPDSLKEWRYLVPRLLECGYQVIAYDQRGFGQSDAPSGEEAYRVDHIVADALAVINHVSPQGKVKIVGHDWGALISWILCLEHGELFDRHVAVSVGHPQAFRSAGLEQKLKSWYVLAWQIRGLSELMISAGDFAALRRMAANDEDKRNWIADLSRPGRLTAGLNWYRANFSLLLARRFGLCSVPTCGIYSCGDVALTPQQMRNSDRFMQADWRYIEIADTSHWIPVEKPDELARHILDWFRRD
jgi:pimeloyl-ACP methyl ester carboxylesterase